VAKLGFIILIYKKIKTAATCPDAAIACSGISDTAQLSFRPCFSTPVPLLRNPPHKN
jgi:hypothetical protein